MWKLSSIVGILLAAAALASASSAPASGGGAEVVKRGSCSAAATWKLKAKKDGAFIETEFEVDQNVAGKKWRVVIRQNGVKRFRGVKTTKAPSGSFTVRRMLDDKPGRDHIVAKTKALATGQSCRGELSI